MVSRSIRELPLHERLTEIEELVRSERTRRALARLDRIATGQLSQEEHLRVLLLYCWVHLEAHEFDLMEKQLACAEQLDPMDPETILLRAHYLAHVGREREAVRAAASMARTSTVEEHTARAYLIIGLALYRARHYPMAVAFCEKSQAYYRWSGNVLLSAWASINLGLCHKALSHCDVALETVRGVLSSLPNDGYKRVRFRARLNEGVILLLLGEIPLARAAFLGTLQQEDQESPLNVSRCLNNVGHTYRMQGNYSVALEYYARAMQVARSHDLNRQLCVSLFWIGESQYSSGDPSSAKRTLLEAERIAKRLRHGGLLQEVLRRRAELATLQGKRKQALQLVSRAWRLSKTMQQPHDEALLRRTELLVRDESPCDADIRDLLGAFRRTGDRYEFSKTVLLVFEALRGRVAENKWLSDVEIEARHYMATMGLQPWLRRLDAAVQGVTSRPATPEEFQRNRDAFECSQIELALSMTSGFASRAAKLLGMSRNTLAQKIKKLGVDRQRTRTEHRRSKSPPS